jgi:hypothetical protein
MLTGTVPFDGEIRDILLGHLAAQPPPLRERNPAVPPEWEALCMHMMEKSRDARFQSVSEIAQVLFDLPRHASAYSAYISARASSTQSGHTMRLDAPGDAQAAAARPTLHVGLEGSLPPVATAPGSGDVPAPPEGAPPDPSDGEAGVAGGARDQPPVQYFSTAQLESLASVPPLMAPPLATSSFPRVDEAELTSGPLIATSYAAAAATTISQLAPLERPSGSAAYPALDGPGAAIAPMAPTSDSTAGMASCYALVTDPRHSSFLATLLVRPPGRWFNVAELCSTSGAAPPAALPPQPLFCAWMDHPWADPSMAAVIFVSLSDGSNTVALCRRVSW